jgi:CheY-like chemotaxis protein
LVFIATGSFFCQKATAFDSTDIAKKGIADLRNKNLQDKPVALNCEWAFVWGRGSVFYFTQTFPVSKNAGGIMVNSHKEAWQNNEMELAGIEILLVEDNHINVLVAKSFLESWGAVIEIAKNGQEALDKLDTNRHKMILMDLHMPVMDGFEATRKIREKGIIIPIIALTASMPGEVAMKVKGLGVNGMVLKPIVPDELYKTVLKFSLPLQPGRWHYKKNC